VSEERGEVLFYFFFVVKDGQFPEAVVGQSVDLVEAEGGREGGRKTLISRM